MLYAWFFLFIVSGMINIGETGEQVNRETGEQANRQAGKQANRQTGKQANRQTGG
jgi:hypothetical protein